MWLIVTATFVQHFSIWKKKLDFYHARWQVFLFNSRAHTTSLMAINGYKVRLLVWLNVNTGHFHSRSDITLGRKIIIWKEGENGRHFSAPGHSWAWAWTSSISTMLDIAHNYRSLIWDERWLNLEDMSSLMNSPSFCPSRQYPVLNYQRRLVLPSSLP
jgi:hypothetical protein